MPSHPLNTMLTARSLSPIIFALVAIVIGAHAGEACASPITFDELTERPLNGVSLEGVIFHSTGGSSDFSEALFGTTQLSYGQTKLMSAPWAVGSTSGELTVEFLAPVGSVAFDLGLTTTQRLADGFYVSLYQGRQLLDTIVVSTTPGGIGPFAFSEAAFAYSSGGVPLSSMTITFGSPGLNYAIDNLTHSVPEPTALPLLAMFLTRLWTARRARIK